MISVRSPIGIPPSPIVAPSTDLDGQTRVNDPNNQKTPGQGQNAYIDRGAIDRVDFLGPTAALEPVSQ